MGGFSVARSTRCNVRGASHLREVTALTYETLLIDRSERIATVTLNRPHALNAITAVMSAELTDALATCSSEAETRVVILAGSGRAFCAGEDVKERPADSVEVRARSTPSASWLQGLPVMLTSH